MKKILPLLVFTTLVLSILACSVGPVTFGSGSQPLATLAPAATLVQPTTAPVKPATPSAALTESDQVLVSLYERVSPGVVSLEVTTDQGAGSGSGFVYDKKGHIVTNFHVVEGATSIEVDFPSGIKVTGKVVGTDLDSDLAVVKVDVAEKDLVPLPLGDSETLKVGQTVIALGNPFGLTGTMTRGIVSAKGRTLESFRQASGGSYFSSGDIIQTDASINPGNSGGPLLNLAGEVIGINRAIRTTGTTTTGDPVNSGIGFSIPINVAKKAVPSLIANGKYDYPYLGITFMSELSLPVIETLKLPRSTGAYITDLVKGGPGEQAGLIAATQSTSITGLKAGGDLVIGVDGRQVRVFNDLIGYILSNKSPGEKVTLTILRGTEQKEVVVTLGKRP
jgi:2-alkenal reductase